MKTARFVPSPNFLKRSQRRVAGRWRWRQAALRCGRECLRGTIAMFDWWQGPPRHRMRSTAMRRMTVALLLLLASLTAGACGRGENVSAPTTLELAGN